jgi:hypothetical protein
MDLKMATMVLAGSVLVHAAVTACTSTSAPTASAQTTPPATATAAPAEVSPEPCSKTYQVTPPPGAPGGATLVHYAEHAYPGKSKEEIAAHVTHWWTIDDPNSELRPNDYSGGLNLQSAVYTRDGFAGAGCIDGKTSYFIWSP